MSDRDPQDRDPFDNLRDLIDEPVAPREAFADELRSRLMREMSASEHSREEQRSPMDAVFAPRPPVAFPIERARKIRPTVILELAAAAVIILGLVAALNRGWFQNDPEPPTLVPAAALQDDSASTPETEPEQTATPVPNTMEPTVAPPGDIPNTIWAVPLPEGESMDFGGLLVDDDTVYRLLATPSFVGVQAVDAETGAVRWQQAHKWAGNLFEIEDDVLYFDGGDTTLVAVDTKTGAERWRALVEGNPVAIDEDDDDDSNRIFVLLDTDFVTALNDETGEQLWVAQGTIPQDPTGGSASIPATGKIAVENNVVAAVSTYGVLSGFDAATGQEIWSHEGYDAAMISILAEDEVFVVSEGAGGMGAGVGVATGGSPAAAGVETGASASGSAAGSAAADACAAHFSTGNGVASTSSASGTPEAGTSTAIGATYGVQGIDPATGDVLWEQQAATGGATVAGQADSSGATVAIQADPGPGGDLVVCSVDAGQGTVSGNAVAGSSVSGEIHVDDDDNLIAIGVVTDGGFTPVGPDPGRESGAAAILTFPDGVSTAEVIEVVTDDAGTFLQLADGTLVKVDTTGPFDDDDDHQEVRDDEDERSPESESDDD